MQLAADGTLIVSATDLVGYLACDHLATLELGRVQGRWEQADPPGRPDDRADPGEGRSPRSGLPRSAPRKRPAGRRDPEGRPSNARPAPCRPGRDARRDARRCGRRSSRRRSSTVDGAATPTSCSSDRTARAPPSAPGATTSPIRSSPARSRAARSSRCASTPSLLEGLQGIAPEWLYVITGDGVRHPHRTDDFSAYFRYVRARFDARVVDGLADGPAATYPDPVDHCRVCTWYPMCIERRRDDDHLSIVAGMRRVDTERLIVGRRADPGRAGGPRPGASGRRHRDAAARRGSASRLGSSCTSARPASASSSSSRPIPPTRAAVSVPSRSRRPGTSSSTSRPTRGRPRSASSTCSGVVEEVDGEPQLPRHLGDLAGGGEGRLRAVHPAGHRASRRPSRRCTSTTTAGTSRARSSGSCSATRRAWTRWTASSAATSWWTSSTSSARASAPRSSRTRSSRSRSSTCRPARVRSPKPASASSPSRPGSRSGDQSILDGIAAYNRDDCVSTWMLRVVAGGPSRGSRRSAGRSWPGSARSPRSRSRPRRSRTGCAASRSGSTALTADLAADDHSAEAEARRLLADLLDWHRREEKSQWWRWFELKDDLTIEELVVRARRARRTHLRRGVER